jgi:diacylglycerol kinase family enzyme
MITVIINTRAGFDDAAALRAALGRADISVIEIESGAAIPAAVRLAIDAGSSIVAAAGGDGTINAVAQALMGTNVTLGIVPAGTLNTLAKALDIPPEPDAIIDVLLHGQVRSIDVGDVNGHIFLSTTTVGVHPMIASAREQYRDSVRAGHWRAFHHAVLNILRRPPLFTLYLQAGGKEVLRRANVVVIASHTYALRRLRVEGHSPPDDGLLTVWVPRTANSINLFVFAIRAILGLAREGVHYDMIPTREALIERRTKELTVTIDGEVRTVISPLRYRLHPAALKVMVP